MEAANLASRHLSASPLLLCEAFADCHVVCLGSKVQWPRLIPESQDPECQDPDYHCMD